MRSFSMVDQYGFARLSGDYNKMHVDAVAARRFMFGRPVVHGIHLVLFALEEWAKLFKQPFTVASLKVNFRKPLLVEDSVHLQVKEESAGRVCLKLLRNEDLLTEINVCISIRKMDDRPVDHRTFFEEASKALTAEELGPSRGKLAIGLDENLAKEFFPALMELMSKIQIAELLTSTRLIGMECPGENSLFSDLNVEFKDPKNENYLIFNVLEYDPRFARVTINIQGPSIQGVLGAFLRPSPKQQPSFSQIRTIVAPEEFSGQSALIIGGTRGLGEVTAKILAAGGAKVLITYFKGVDDARRIQEELSRSGSLVQTIFFDAGAPEQVDNSVISAFSPTHLYYFATPFIFDGVKKRFSERLFDSFIDTYVKGFWRVFEKVNACKSLRFVLYPSTSALDEMPINMFEYAVAKAAGESMCAYIKKFFPDVAVVTPRLQRLATDQTVSLVAVNNQDPVPEMLKHLRGSL